MAVRCSLLDNQSLTEIEGNMTSEDSHVGPVDSSRADCDTETIPPLDERAPHPSPPTGETVMDHLGRLFDHRVQQVSRLETQRNELTQELLRLREPFHRVVGHLRGKLVETHRLLALAQLDHVAVSEDAREAKRRLFAAARGCIQSQVTLAEREYEVAQSAVTQVQEPLGRRCPEWVAGGCRVKMSSPSRHLPHIIRSDLKLSQ